MTPSFQQSAAPGDRLADEDTHRLTPSFLPKEHPMSLSNEQIRHVIGDSETRDGVAWIAQRLRDLVPTVQRSIGQSMMAGEDPSDLQPVIDQGNSLTQAADLIDRLCEYLGCLEA